MSLILQTGNLISTGQSAVVRYEQVRPIARMAKIVNIVFAPMRWCNEHIRDPLCATGSKYFIEGGRRLCRRANIDLLSYEFECQSLAMVDGILNRLSDQFRKLAESEELPDADKDESKMTLKEVYSMISNGLSIAATPIKIGSRMDRLYEYFDWTKASRMSPSAASSDSIGFLGRIFNFVDRGITYIENLPIDIKVNMAKRYIEPMLRETAALTATKSIGFVCRRAFDCGTALALSGLASISVATVTTTVATAASEVSSLAPVIAKTAEVSSYLYVGAPIVYESAFALRQACRRKSQVKSIREALPLEKINEWKSMLKAKFPLNDETIEKLLNVILFAGIDSTMEILNRTNFKLRGQLETLLADREQVEKLMKFCDQIIQLIARLVFKK